MSGRSTSFRAGRAIVTVTRAGLMEFSREILLGLEAPSEVERGEFPTRSSRCAERVGNEAGGDTAPTGGPERP
jgi:hypothetical protein